MNENSQDINDSKIYCTTCKEVTIHQQRWKSPNYLNSGLLLCIMVFVVVVVFQIINTECDWGIPLYVVVVIPVLIVLGLAITYTLIDRKTSPWYCLRCGEEW
jgi:uncharacterized membrane protein YhaH (DUF805 family)